ncbi:peptidyl-tRNA hydrolase [Ophiocordyceps sinensis CO18]|nr:peptidyl-tRNA hydrolase [Ophiocordyceps sinensis CO18]
MRLAVSAIFAALPLLASAEGSPFAQYQAHLQNFLGRVVSGVPNPGIHDPVAALEAKMGSMKLSTLTLGNWKQTLYEPVAPGATVPEEWWVLITGRNKTCLGHCDKVEQAFNETAAKFALTPGSPHMGYLNCDDQPILCNSWSASTAHIWSFAMLPPPAPVEIYKKRLNLTTTTSSDLVALQSSKAEWTLLESWFHPFNGQVAQNGLAVPYGYVMWAFNLVPNWLFMVIVSFASRSMM